MNKNQLIEEIASKVDDRDYRLVLKQDGRFELIDLEEWDWNFPYVTRWETFDFGDDYVGVNASKDMNFIDTVYKWAEIAWKKYKEDGQIHITNMMS